MLNRNNSTRNFFYTENGNNNKCKYSSSTVSTSNSLNLNQSFEFNSNQKGNFCDNDLDNNMNNFFCSMDFDNETQTKIKEIKDYYWNKQLHFINQYKIKKDTILRNYCSSEGYDYQYYLDNKYKKKHIFGRDNIKKIKNMEDKLNQQYWEFLDLIENNKNNAITNYKNQRNIYKKNNNLWDLKL